MASSSEGSFPSNAKDYELFEEIGDGVGSIVYRARCIELDEIVAIKILDFAKCSNDMESIRKEVNIVEHPNLLRPHCSFIDASCLWIVMPYMSAGSCYHIMKSVYPQGLQQSVIATLLREVLKALLYLHEQGHVHRDVKAGNVLVDSNGTVKLADFGVSESVERMRTSNTFITTPCWMAPEVMQQADGYDFKADIWSFGITALELAHGHAPFSENPLMKVLLMTLQNASCLDYDKNRKFSMSFGELVATCLVKDPKNRPSAANLLKHPFFENSQSTEYLALTILDGLSPLSARYGKLKEEKAKLLEGIDGNKEKASQQEYMRGISAWNFDVEDLAKLATTIPDNELSIPSPSWSTEKINILSNAENSVCNEEALAIAEIDPDKLKTEDMLNIGGPASPVNPVSCNGAVVLPLLQNILVQNEIQRGRLTGLLQVIGQNAGNRDTEGGQTARETELESEVNLLKQSVQKLEEEVERQKTVNAQLEAEINRLTKTSDP